MSKAALFQAWWDEKAPNLAQYLTKWKLPDTRVHRLKWMLKCTLGSPQAFLHRQQELAQLESKAVSDISEEDVLASFDRSVLHPEGEVVTYLQNAQILGCC